MTDKPGWFRIAMQLRESVAPTILPRVLLFSGFGLFVSLLHSRQVPMIPETLGELTTNVVYNLVLGLLLVFRTNTSYERFWEGRKAWGTLVVNIRNLTREIGVGFSPDGSGEQEEKVIVLRLLAAFAVATRLHLRQEPMNEELRQLLPAAEVERLASVSNLPLDITLLIGGYLQRWCQAAQLDPWRFPVLNEALSNLVEGLTHCERILTTPLPIVYVIYLRHLTLIYCVILPFTLVTHLGWWTALIVAIVSFILFGIEQVSQDLENPFGRDLNDLPLEEICGNILANVEAMTNFVPEEQSSCEIQGTPAASS